MFVNRPGIVYNNAGLIKTTLYLCAGDVVELTHAAAGQEDDLPGQVGAAWHPDHQVGVVVPVEPTQRQRVA